MLPVEPIPAPGFRMVSGKQGPRKPEAEYEVQFRSGFVDRKNVYTARQMVWVHDKNKPSAWDVVAVREV
jgi:hypothetical protein